MPRIRQKDPPVRMSDPAQCATYLQGNTSRQLSPRLHTKNKSIHISVPCCELYHITPKPNLCLIGYN